MGVGKSHDTDLIVIPRLTSAGMVEVPRSRPDGEMLPSMAYRIVMDKVMRDGNAPFNRAAVVTTWMDDTGRSSLRRHLRQEHDRQGPVPRTAGIESHRVRMNVGR